MNPDLSQLHDIHLPPSPSWWPPAPGWWVLAGLLIAVAVATRLPYRRHRARHWRREALAELNTLRQAATHGELSSAELAGRVSQLLRRVAISRFPRNGVASLSGEAWLAFLDARVDGKGEFLNGTGRVLLDAPYQREVDLQIEPQALLQLAERWIRRHRLEGAHHV